MNQYQIQPNWKIFSWLALAGIILYLLVQVLPSTSEAFFGTGSEKVIAKSEAERAAADFAERQFKQKPVEAHAVHQSDSLLYGYLSKEKLLNEYDKEWDAAFPTDTFQVNTKMPDGSLIFIYVHMQKGTVVGWNRYNASDSSVPGPTEQDDAALKFAVSQGFQARSLKISNTNPSTGEVRLDVADHMIADARLVLEVRSEKLPGGGLIIAKYEPKFIVPSGYSTYVEQQTKLASFLSLLGSLLLSFVLFVLAIIYASLYRKHSSFKRGIVLSLVFLFVYLANNISMTDGILAAAGENPNAVSYAVVTVAITSIVTVVMAAAAYFSLVGGDALWNSMGRRLWPRFGEAGYGEYVWRSMWLGYLFALILLGLQTVIFIVLLNVTGAWSTTDVTQSPYNLAAPWIFPMMAWCAAISEEAVYRLFGIGLLKKWFKNTFVAALIPTIIWALGHVTYPIFPSTTRLFELTIIGLAFSFMFVRYGFITVLFAHAVFDSIMMAISLMFMGTAVNILTGIIYIILPIPIAWSIRWFDKRTPKRALTLRS
ncbi:CPBP family intramembrane metalloprotease [Paenibacillus sp. sptzw28]|uniref:CPBP family intramembrane glutamic endopeptidase n=1 Tax=Paenibacillus sp. sptzw28 TaxID=715179 RepID=UPI001C6EF89B|nr:CPBP family intramembrane glutamic endopeptidase [Paenibacillus sp. sptzw28]QYR20493.1 CPBP family intramembrane metalloprotease [Paenibacillus sp. sptzw28]